MATHATHARRNGAGTTAGARTFDDYKSLVSELNKQADDLTERLGPWYSRNLRHRALFLRHTRRPSAQQVLRGYDEGRGASSRPEGQQFRSVAAVPLVQRTVESQAASIATLLTRPDPMIDCEATNDRKYGEPARFVSRLLSRTLYRNRIRSNLVAWLRDIGTDGIKFCRTYWRRDTTPVWVPYSKSDLDTWNERVLEATQVLDVEPPDIPAEEDPKLWQEWLTEVNKTGKLKKPIPDIPITGRRHVVHYDGPAVQGVWFGDVLAHPEMAWEDQPVIIHQQWIREDALQKQADGKGPGDMTKPLDARALQYAIDRGSKWYSSERQSTLERYYRMLGVDHDPTTDEKTFGNHVLLQSFYRRFDDEPFLLLANRCAIINKDTTTMPFAHGRVPLFPVRRVHLDGYLMGLSSVQQSEPLAYEANRILAHVLDALILAILPVFTRLQDSPLPARLLRLSAGAVIPVKRHDAIQALTKGTTPDMGGALSLINYLASWNDDSEGTPAVLRGQSSAQGGRPSATSIVQDKAMATDRIAAMAMAIEDDFDELPRQHLGLWYEIGEEGTRQYVGGSGDPYVTVDKGKIGQVLDMDFGFRGATRAIDRMLLVNSIYTWLDKFAAILLPSEVRAAAARVWEENGLRRKDEILLSDYTALLAKEDEIQVQQRAAATMAPKTVPVGAIPAAPSPTAASAAPAPPVGAAPPGPAAGGGGVV